MRQKLELLTDEIVSFSEPGDSDLQKYLEENPEVFRMEPIIDLRQIYISLDKRGTEADGHAQNLLDQLRQDQDGITEIDWRELGDSLPLPSELRGARSSEISRQFGQQFTDSIIDMAPGEWTGPVLSGYGLHLVMIDLLVPARDPALDEVRERVKMEWMEMRRRSATDQLYDQLAENYRIEIESLVEDNTE